jgi:hypothetical protein
MSEKERLLDYIKSIKILADELQEHAEEIASDKYGCQEISIKNAWAHLEILRQDYFPDFKYDKALF